MKKIDIYWIKYIDYFDNGKSNEKVYTYSSPHFTDIKSFYEVITSDRTDSIGYAVVDISKSFQQMLDYINNL